jgi:hypothetical protein
VIPSAVHDLWARPDCHVCTVYASSIMTLLPPDELDGLLAKYGVAGVSIAVLRPDGAGDASVSTQVAGLADREKAIEVFDSTFLQICSLSKPIAAVYAHQYFAQAGTPFDTSVNELLAQSGSPYRFRPADACPASWVCLRSRPRPAARRRGVHIAGPVC